MFTCTRGRTCQNSYGGNPDVIHGTKRELQNMCADDSWCEAIQYRTDKHYFGALCSSKLTRSSDVYEVCVILRGTGISS